MSNNSTTFTPIPSPPPSPFVSENYSVINPKLARLANKISAMYEEYERGLAEHSTDDVQ